MHTLFYTFLHILFRKTLSISPKYFGRIHFYIFFSFDLQIKKKNYCPQHIIKKKCLNTLYLSFYLHFVLELSYSYLHLCMAQQTIFISKELRNYLQTSDQTLSLKNILNKGKGQDQAPNSTQLAAIKIPLIQRTNFLACQLKDHHAHLLFF